jgi:hypothetical protein
MRLEVIEDSEVGGGMHTVLECIAWLDDKCIDAI